MNSRYRDTFPPCSAAHASTIVADDEMRMTVLSVASGMLSD